MCEPPLHESRQKHVCRSTFIERGGASPSPFMKLMTTECRAAFAEAPVQVVCHTGAGQAFERDPHVLGHGRWCEAGAPSENKYKLGRAQVEPHGVRPPRIHEIARLAAAPHPRTMARIAAYRRDLLLTDSVASASQVRATSNKTLHPGTIPGPCVLTPPIMQNPCVLRSLPNTETSN